MTPLLTKCKCGVPMFDHEKVLHCDFGSCPRKHEHDDKLWQEIKKQEEKARS
jgi:hypothetical protein